MSKLSIFLSICATIAAISSAASACNSAKQAKESNDFQKYQSSRNQANKIAVWDADRNYNNEHKNEIIIQNDSNLPIYDVSVFIVRNTDKSKSIDNIKINKNEYSCAEIYPPNETSIWLNGQSDKNGIHDNVAIIFKDATSKNNYWYRDVKGNLNKISENKLKQFYKKTSTDYYKRTKIYKPHIIIEKTK